MANSTTKLWRSLVAHLRPDPRPASCRHRLGPPASPSDGECAYQSGPGDATGDVGADCSANRRLRRRSDFARSRTGGVTTGRMRRFSGPYLLSPPAGVGDFGLEPGTRIEGVAPNFGLPARCLRASASRRFAFFGCCVMRGAVDRVRSEPPLARARGSFVVGPSRPWSRPRVLRWACMHRTQQ